MKYTSCNNILKIRYGLVKINIDPDKIIKRNLQNMHVNICDFV